MRLLHEFEKYSLIISALIISLASGCGDAAPPVTEAPVVTEEPVSALDFREIDQALRESVTGSIAYNSPYAMRLNETATIELLLNPSVEPPVLATQTTAEGQVISASIHITPRMKAVLIPQEEDTFSIQAMHDSPEQLISTTETTKWSWDVTAKKGGTHRLTLVIYRLITVDNNDSWRLVESYRSDIQVDVTMIQRLLMLDWTWIAGIILTALLIPAFWRWMDQRRNPGQPVTKSKQPKKKGR
jgi:hypothetical protein